MLDGQAVSRKDDGVHQATLTHWAIDGIELGDAGGRVGMERRFGLHLHPMRILSSRPARCGDEAGVVLVVCFGEDQDLAGGFVASNAPSLAG